MCILQCCRLRVFDLPADVLDEPEAAKDVPSADTLQSVLQVDEGETVYDYAWYPGMLVSEPASCVFACTARVSFPVPHRQLACYLTPHLKC